MQTAIVPVTIKNDLNRVIRPFSKDLEAGAIETLNRAASITAVTSAESHALAGAVYKALASHEKEIEKARKAAKDPVLRLGTLIDDAAKRWTNDLSTSRARLGKAIADFEAEQRRIAEEYEREQRRIAAARVEAERAERLRQEQEAAAALADELDFLDDAPPAPVAPPVVVPAVPVATVAAPEALGKSAIKMVPHHEARIINAALIPREYMVPDVAAILAALRGGTVVPGAELVTEMRPAARGGR
jgi:hypothetical protein